MPTADHAAPSTTGILQALTVLCAPDSVVELRCLAYQEAPSRGKRRYTSTLSGYFDDLEALAREAAQASPHAKGTYVTLNPVAPALLARCANRTEVAQQGTSTADKDILHRRWFALDFDPVRDAHISASDAEHEAAQGRAQACQDWLTTACGFPEPLAADSGNGAHRLYRIDLPNDAASRTLLEMCLTAVAFACEYHRNRKLRDTLISLISLMRKAV